MKNLFLCIAVLVFVSCEKETFIGSIEDASLASLEKSESGILRSAPCQLSDEEALVVLRQYVDIEENQYEISLDESGALELGISIDFFQYIVSEIKKVNDYILSSESEGIDIILTDPKTVDAVEECLVPLVATRSEPAAAPSGIITIREPQKPSSSPTFWLPVNYAGFNISGSFAAPTLILQVTTSFLADNTTSLVGVMGIVNGNVRCNASNCYGYITVACSDPSGGTVFYKAVASI
ncbi:hypothetical protein [Bacteroides acidifaciens]|uniref:hypothetical protein n=1 Tax=Bacteroides acidifaciens TaxID=85831 RepID=UPI002675253E|nr:hypothetical protein [Bacteroides acidifaciens]